MADTTTDRILFRLKTRGALAIAELGAAFGITSEAVRQLLVKAEAEGLVAYDDRREGRGRPKRIWRLTEAGHARFPDRHPQPTVRLPAPVAAEFADDGLDRPDCRPELPPRTSYPPTTAP